MPGRRAKRGSLAIFGLCLLLLFMAACGGAAKPAENKPADNKPAAAPAPAEPKLTKINITAGPDPASSNFAYVAQDQGLFKKNGLDATIKVFTSSIEGNNAVAAGEADIGAASEMSWMNIAAAGAQLYSVMIYARSGDYIKLISQNSINKPEDWVGKKVGVVKGTTSEMFWDLYAAKIGLKPGQVEKAYLQPQEMLALLDKGDLAGMFIWEPIASNSLETVSKGKVKKVIDSSEVGGYVNVSMLVRKAFADQNPDAVKALIKTYVEAKDFTLKNPDKAAEITAKVIKQDVAATKKLIQATQWPFVFDKVTGDLVKSTTDWLVANKKIPQATNWANVIKPDFLEATVPGSVTWKPQ